jgi:hypothetical protein
MEELYKSKQDWKKAKDSYQNALNRVAYKRLKNLSMLSSELWTRLFEFEKKVALESKSNILRLPPVRM